MDTLDVLRICVKRWFVFLPILLLAYYASQSLSSDRQPVYSATGSFAVIYHPTTALKPGQADPRQLNPLAAGGGSLLKQALLTDLRSPGTQRQLAAPGVSGTSPSAAADGSLFAVTSTATSATVGIATYGPSQEAVAGTVNRVLAASASKARQMQDRAGAPAAGRLDTFVTLPTQTTVLAPASKLKLVIAVMAAGLIAGAGLSLLLDRLLSKWRPRRGKTAGPQRDDRPLRRRRARRDEAVTAYEPDLDATDVKASGLKASDLDGPDRGEPDHEPVSELARAGQASSRSEETG
jgi:hypothetical protein